MTEEAKDELPEIAIRLGEMDGFRRAQVIALSDSLAQANGELAVLRSRIEKLTGERIEGLEQIIREKDEQITEQSNTIRKLRGDA